MVCNALGCVCWVSNLHSWSNWSLGIIGKIKGKASDERCLVYKGVLVWEQAVLLGCYQGSSRSTPFPSTSLCGFSRLYTASITLCLRGAHTVREVNTPSKIIHTGDRSNQSLSSPWHDRYILSVFFSFTKPFNPRRTFTQELISAV